MSDPVIAAIIALCGAVIASALSNFAAEAYRRHRDAMALAGALAGELGAIYTTYQHTRTNMVEALNFVTQGIRLSHAKSAEDRSWIWESNSGRIGLLGPQLAEDVSFIYGHILGIRSSISALQNIDSQEHLRDYLDSIITAIDVTGVKLPSVIAALREKATLGFFDSL